MNSSQAERVNVGKNFSNNDVFGTSGMQKETILKPDSPEEMISQEGNLYYFLP